VVIGFSGRKESEAALKEKPSGRREGGREGEREGKKTDFRRIKEKMRRSEKKRGREI